mmetsp:Transcript_13646/g.28534  ORF Transcript_13646/g.28534 Transcript_13646/m.28534 type:complete len:80 (+) Transcript_13646:446-685(+)
MHVHVRSPIWIFVSKRLASNGMGGTSATGRELCSLAPRLRLAVRSEPLALRPEPLRVRECLAPPTKCAAEALEDAGVAC